MGDANRQRAKGPPARLGPAVVIPPPADQVSTEGQAAAVLGASLNGCKNIARRRCRPFVCVPSPACCAVTADRAGMIPSGIHHGELPGRRIGLLVAISSPTGDASVCPQAAGESPSSRDLTESDTVWNIQLALVIGAPAKNASILLQCAPMAFTDGDFATWRRGGHWSR